MIVKEEPKSPIPSALKKRKGHSIDANAIGQVDPIDIDIDPPQTVGKRRKTVASGSSHVQFDGVAIPDRSNPVPKATRRSKVERTPRTCFPASRRSSAHLQRLVRSWERRSTDTDTHIM